MTMAATSTPCTIQRSNFQARRDLSLSCRQGSPMVSASPPQPQTQLQYHRLPTRWTIRGTPTTIRMMPHTSMNSPMAPALWNCSSCQPKKKS